MSTKNKSQLQLQLQQLQKKKTKLQQKKTEAPNRFTEEEQGQLVQITEQIIDLEEQIELEGENETSAYVPKPGTEKLIHVKLTKGARFDENTGKEISSPYIQMFTFGEYENFRKNAELIGYKIIEELYNPYKNR